jgi:hypothetical protein
MRTSPPLLWRACPLRARRSRNAASEGEYGGSDSRRGARQEYGESDGESEEEEQQPGAKRARKSGGRHTQRQHKALLGWRATLSDSPPDNACPCHLGAHALTMRCLAPCTGRTGSLPCGQRSVSVRALVSVPVPTLLAAASCVPGAHSARALRTRTRTRGPVLFPGSAGAGPGSSALLGSAGTDV